jgi:adenylate cyclase
MLTAQSTDTSLMQNSLAVDSSTKTELRLVPVFKDVALQFATQRSNGYTEIQIPLTADTYEKLRAAFDRSPEKQTLEIERKWKASLEDGLNYSAAPDVVKYEIVQGYVIISDDVEVRVRSSHKQGDSEAKYYLTIKGSGDLVRSEAEVEIQKTSFELLLGVCTHERVVRKTRFAMPDGAEIDLYKQAGPQKATPPDTYLPVATIEREYASEAAIAQSVTPSWYGEDVTSNKGYKNKNLAVKGFPAT